MCRRHGIPKNSNGNEKGRSWTQDLPFRSVIRKSHRPGNFTGTQAPGTNVHMARGTVHNRLDPLDIGLPSAVGPAVGVGNLDAKGNTLVAKLTFSHPLHLLAVRDIAGAKAPCGMIPEFDTKCKRKFQNHRNFFCLVKAGGLYYNYPIYAPRFRGARGRDRR